MASRTPWSKIAPAGGAYRISLRSGLTTVINAGEPIFSCRWTSTTLKCIVQKIKWNYMVAVAFGAAQLIDHGLYIARAFTASDTGGTAATISGNNCKLDTLFPSTAFAAGDIRIATTGLLTAGTRTLDTQPIITKAGWTVTTAGTYVSDPSMEYLMGNADATNPITLRVNEGLVLAPLTTMGASGQVYVYFEMEWTEVPVNLS
jgi:hypothetical protein